MLNFLSCPFGIGVGEGSNWQEFVANRGLTLPELINYRHHPIDVVPQMIEYRVPVFLICGDSDRVVPYAENGALLHRMYTEAGAPIQLILKPGCDHHPHPPALYPQG